MTTTTVTGLYDTYDAAARTVRDLEAAHIPYADISMVAHRSDATVASGTPPSGAATGAEAGASAGAVLGGGTVGIAGDALLGAYAAQIECSAHFARHRAGAKNQGRASAQGSHAIDL